MAIVVKTLRVQQTVQLPVHLVVKGQKFINVVCAVSPALSSPVRPLIMYYASVYSAFMQGRKCVDELYKDTPHLILDAILPPHFHYSSMSKFRPISYKKGKTAIEKVLKLCEII